jgi:catechol-2,3-dioxygenase
MHKGVHHIGLATHDMDGTLEFYFAFWCDDEDELSQRQQELRALAVDVTDVVDHGWCKSIYFKDPNHIQLEYCCYVGELDSSHVADRDSDAWMRVSKR